MRWTALEPDGGEGDGEGLWRDGVPLQGRMRVDADIRYNEVQIATMRPVSFTSDLFTRTAICTHRISFMNNNYNIICYISGYTSPAENHNCIMLCYMVESV